MCCFWACSLVSLNALCVRVCACHTVVTEYNSLSEFSVKRGCVNGLRDRNDESSYQQAERPQLPTSSNLTLR